MTYDTVSSNEDAIAPFERWTSAYSDRIAVVGGFDLGFLCSKGDGSRGPVRSGG